MVQVKNRLIVTPLGLDRYGIIFNGILLFNWINDTEMRMVLYALEQASKTLNIPIDIEKEF